MIQQMSVQQLKQRLERNDSKPMILDVREPWEVKLCALANSTLIPMGQIPAAMDELDKDREIVVLCHHGIRSNQVAYFMHHHGFGKLFNLQGGIDAWARQIDPTIQTY